MGTSIHTGGDQGPQEVHHRVRGDRGSVSEGQQREALLRRVLELGEALCAGPREPPGLDGTDLARPERSRVNPTGAGAGWRRVGRLGPGWARQMQVRKGGGGQLGHGGG